MTIYCMVSSVVLIIPYLVVRYIRITYCPRPKKFTVVRLFGVKLFTLKYLKVYSLECWLRFAICSLYIVALVCGVNYNFLWHRW